MKTSFMRSSSRTNPQLLKLSLKWKSCWWEWHDTTNQFLQWLDFNRQTKLYGSLLLLLTLIYLVSLVLYFSLDEVILQIVHISANLNNSLDKLYCISFFLLCYWWCGSLHQTSADSLSPTGPFYVRNLPSNAYSTSSCTVYNYDLHYMIPLEL